jgi:flagellar biosynthetic protein FliO
MEMFQQLLTIAVVLGVLCGGMWLLKRKGYAYSRVRKQNGAGYPRLEILDRLALSPHHSLHLVRLADRTMLIGVSPNDCKLLESGKELGAGFGQLSGLSGQSMDAPMGRAL